MAIQLPDSIARLTQNLSLDDSLCLIWAAIMVLASILVCNLAISWLRHRIEKKTASGDHPAPAGPPAPGKATPLRMTIKQRLALRTLPLLAPMLNLIALYIGVTVIAGMEHDAGLLDSLKPLAYSWLIVTAIFVITANVGKTVFVAILLIPGSMPFVVPYLREVAKVLREIAFTFGKTEITALMVVKVIIAGVLLMWITAAITSGIHMSLARISGMRWATRQLLQNILTIAIYAVALLMLLGMLGIDLTAFAVLGGALGVGLGFGLQKIASNFISGLILLSEQVIQVDDEVEIAGSNVKGQVRHTGARYTMVETPDNRSMMIPNDDLITGRVLLTRPDTRGVLRIEIGVGYDSDLDLVRTQLLEAAAANAEVLDQPAPVCQIKNFGQHAIEFQLLTHINDARDRRGAVKSEILFDIWRRFRKLDIKIPSPQMTLNYTGAPLPLQPAAETVRDDEA